MNKNDRDKALEYLLDERTGDAAGEMPVLDEEELAEVEALVAAADLFTEVAHDVPPLEEDPVAAMLGLIPDPEYSLDPKKLTRAMKDAGKTPSGLVERLASRGWNVALKEVYRWGTRGAPEVSPALIRAMAEEMGIQPDNLVTDRHADEENDEVAAVMASTDFQELVARWAESQGMPQALARSTLKSRMLTTVHRGERPNAAQMLHSLAAFIAAHEEDPGL
ncbi:hypothetical protein AB0H60_35625 [Nocardia rhamnosiphila]|uniref:hypothetical protein n=1 Tax=Nocardia rhamnosiphila TaxID=426716 RepID=UPI00340032EA